MSVLLHLIWPPPFWFGGRIGDRGRRLANTDRWFRREVAAHETLKLRQ
jgi:hypothetical protein